MRRIATGILIIVVVIFTSFKIGLCTKTQSPMEVVKLKIDRIINTLTDKNLTVEEKQKIIREIIDQTIYWNEVSKRVLGIYWRTLKPEQKEEFSHLFREFIKKIYARKFLRYSGEKIRYKKQEINDGLATVYMDLITTKKQIIPISCKLFLKDGNWLVYDIFIEGISMVNNYRVQINRIIARRGFDYLIKILKRKVQKR